MVASPPTALGRCLQIPGPPFGSSMRQVMAACSGKRVTAESATSGPSLPGKLLDFMPLGLTVTYFLSLLQLFGRGGAVSLGAPGEMSNEGKMRREPAFFIHSTCLLGPLQRCVLSSSVVMTLQCMVMMMLIGEWMDGFPWEVWTASRTIVFNQALKSPPNSTRNAMTQ